MPKVLSFLFFLIVSTTCISQVKFTGLLTENRVNPVGLDADHPRFTWQILADRKNLRQTGYSIYVYANGVKKPLWGSGKIETDQSVQVPYGGPKLQPGKKYNWQVKIWDNFGRESGWSESSAWQTGFFDTSSWKAKWIEPGYAEDPSRPSPLFRKEFAANKKIQNAIVYITCHGLYEATINGQRIGDAYLTPGWTSYNKRLQYQVYDVTPQLKSGANCIGVTLASGWYRGVLGWSDNKGIYGKDIALLFQMDIVYSDGTSESIVSDKNWKTSTGEIRSAEIYNGETIDAREQKTGWELAGYNDGDWTAAKEAAHPLSNLLATWNEPVKKHETFKPKRIFKTPAGEQVIDFGQNLVGWVTLKVRGNTGDKIVISHAEVLDKEGNFYTKNLRAAKAQDIYILKGGGEEIFEPHFTWHGFQFIKIEGYPGEIKADDFTAVAMYSDMKPTGSFETSNQLINQLQHNIQWGQKGNFLDVPTDCPQRDERLGWTGDAQAFSRTATFNMNVNSFFAKWLRDIEADQKNGVVPFVIPNILGDPISSAGWADVATIAPWNMYLAYGDKKILENQYSSMKAYVESIRRVAKNDLWNSGFHFGDWLFYRPDDDNDGSAAVTDKYLIAQCFYANSTQLLIKTAKVLKKDDDVKFYTDLLQKIKDAYFKEYVTPNGRLVSSTQTAYTLALNFDMLPENLRAQAAERLVQNIKNYGNHLTTGFLGTPYLCHVLTRFGYTDVAYKLLTQQTYPSWLYPVKMGATTIWERWDGIKPDSSFQTPGMNSYNHYAYGAIGDWMYRVMVGLDTYDDAPGYKHIRIKPHIGGDFTNASASLLTYYGKLSSGWKVENGKTTMDVEIPANTTATVYIPAKDAADIQEGGKPISGAADIKLANKEEGYVVVELGSGQYHFEIKN